MRRKIAEELGAPTVIKSQVLTGGRMKAGGVKFADTPEEAERHAADILELEINGHMPRGVLVDSRVEVAQEYYAGVTWDGTRKRPVLIFSDMGGIDIEEVAETHPDHVGRAHFSTLRPFSDYEAKQVIASVGVTGRALTRLTPILSRLARLFIEYDMTLAEINPLAQLADGSFVAVDAHMDMENEARPRQKAILEELGVGDEETRQAREATPFELAGEAVDQQDHRGVAGNVTEFDGDLGLVIGAGGGSLTLFDAVRAHGGKPANYCEIGGNPSVAKACGLAKLVLQKPGVDKIAVMMSIVSNTRVDIVARGVIKACVELGYDPAEKISIFRIPGAWEEEGFKILEKYGVKYADRSVSLNEAARMAVAAMYASSDHGDADDARFIVQGITGREAVNLTRECLDYGAGAKIVGGVTPGRLGREVHGVPVFDTVAQAVEHHGGPIDGSVVTVPPAFTKDAVIEAIANGVKLVVIVTERIPRGDVAQMVEFADEHGARIIGPNCLGIIVPDVIKMGGIGGPAKDAAKSYSPGPVGVISRSGGMTTEMSSTLTAAGLGQSTAVSIGGDAIIGSTYAELMPLFEADEETAGDRHLHRAGRPDGGPAVGVGHRAQLAAAGGGVHGRPVHGRDAGHVLRPRRHDRRGQGGHRDREDRAARGGRDRRRRADRGHPRARARQDRGRGLMALFIDVEVAPEAASDAAVAAKLAEVCPVDIFAVGDGGALRDRRGEPRRVRAVPAVHRRGARGQRDRAQALRRRGGSLGEPGIERRR